MVLTPYMNLDLPGVLMTPGPDYASMINAALEKVSSHDHTSGKGKKISVAGLNIDSDLSFGNYTVDNLESLGFYTQTSALSTSTFLNSMYVLNGELIFIDGSGNDIQVTASGSLNVSATGNISGMTGTTAAVTYNNSSKTFYFTQSSGVAAHIQGGILYLQEGSGSDYVALKAPTSVSSNYTLTLPAAVASASNSFLKFTSGGEASWHTLSTAGLTYFTYDAASGIFTLAQIAPATDINTSGASLGQALRFTGTGLGYASEMNTSGTSGSPTLVAHSGSLAIPSGHRHAKCYIAGNGGAATITLAAGAFQGQKLTLTCTSNTDTITLVSSATLLLNGMCTLAANESISLEWDVGTTAWCETSRSN